LLIVGLLPIRGLKKQSDVQQNPNESRQIEGHMERNEKQQEQIDQNENWLEQHQQILVQLQVEQKEQQTRYENPTLEQKRILSYREQGKNNYYRNILIKPILRL